MGNIFTLFSDVGDKQWQSIRYSFANSFKIYNVDEKLPNACNYL